MINLDEYSDIGTHWIAFYALYNNVTYSDIFDVESKHLLAIKTYKNIFRIQTYDSVMCQYFCIESK